MILIKFNKKIYPLKAIKKAVRDYGIMAKFSISNTNKYANVRISFDNDNSNDQIKEEFCNYVLSLVKAD